MVGLVFLVAGLLLTRFYKQVADNLGSGASSYDRFKLVGIISAVAGLLIMFNLHVIILDFIANTFFGALVQQQ